MRFDEETLRRLERLSLEAQEIRVGRMKGSRRSRKHGASPEFADYRSYVRGDDLRRLDWNIYARLERPFIKLLEDEEDLTVHLLIDASASMDWPDEPRTNKLHYAQQLAVGLGHIALQGGDLLHVSATAAPTGYHWGPVPGGRAGQTLALIKFLETIIAAGTTALDKSLREYALRPYRPGLLFLLSDLFSPEGYRHGVRALLARGYEVVIIHLLSPDEIEPELEGELRLIDSETGAVEELSLNPMTIQNYRRRLQGWLVEQAAWSAQWRVHYVPVNTNDAWDSLIMKTLRSRRIIK
jgi:uncharacterized protein (DUF58 family)